MGEAKQKKQRLGQWYGKPVVPGHPDYQPPMRAEPEQPTNEGCIVVVSDSVPHHVPKLPRPDLVAVESARLELLRPRINQRPNAFRMMAILSALTAGTAGIAIPPAPRKRDE